MYISWWLCQNPRRQYNKYLTLNCHTYSINTILVYKLCTNSQDLWNMLMPRDEKKTYLANEIVRASNGFEFFLVN
jgi:hypothetical protein